MRSPIPGDRPLIDAVRAARAAPAAMVALREFYADVAAAVAAVGQTCRACGACCDFDAYGHRLYVTTLELALLTAEPPAAPAGPGRCPYQHGAACAARDRRALGCRVFSCSQAAADAEQAIYARFHERLGRLHAEHGIPYLYLDLPAAAAALAGGDSSSRTAGRHTGGRDMPPRTGTLTVVAFGDSITQASHQEAPYRWVTLVQDQLNRRLSDTAAAVLNAGAGGETSREGLRRLQRDVLDVRPDIVLVEFGGNDATPDDGRQVGLEEFGDNLHLISTECRKIHAQVMILTFPPIIDAWHCWGRHDRYAETNGPNAHVERYRQAARRYACDHRLALIDIARLLEEAARKDSPQSIILPDGVHLTQAGNRIVAQAVADAIVARQRPLSDV